MFIIAFFAFIPVIIWAFMEPLGLRFADVVSTTTSIGQILGLVGMVLFSVNLILAGKFKFLDKHFKGLDKVYKNHHRLGAIAFSIMLFHPIFLVVKFITISIRDAGLFFVPFTNGPITWGILSLIVLIILICLTFYAKIKYKNWKLSHKFMTFAFFLAVIHTFLIQSDVSRNSLLRYYIFTLAILALFTIFRKVFFEQTKIDRLRYKVVKIKEFNISTVEIEMEPVGEKMNFTPGQFAFFSFIGDAISPESHPFSISSSNLDNNLRIIAKNFGDFTSELKKIKIDDQVVIEGPFGGFSYKNGKSKNQIWIAGGIGITPFLSMSQTLEKDYNINLFYSVKEPSEAVRVNNLEMISKENPNFKFNPWVTRDKGYITAEQVKGLSNGLDGKDIFLCGPPVFMKSLKDQFVTMGVDINNIRYESFNF